MGAVYEVQHLNLRRNFALKRLSPELATREDALARFRREADVVASLRHPNVVEVTDWETLPDGTPCIVMEYLVGRDLRERINRTGALPWPFLGRIADEVMSALCAAHRAGIVHRDLKPENIFVVEDGEGGWRAKLLDFGVSKYVHADQVTQRTGEQLIGTPAYMSPEQAEGKSAEVAPDTDVWAMGAILFEMATAHLAFPAATTMSMLYRICHGEPEPLLAHRPDAPPAFVETVRRALSRDPRLRIATMAALRSDVRAALEPVAPGAFARALSTGDVTSTTVPAPDDERIPTIARPRPLPMTPDAAAVATRRRWPGIAVGLAVGIAAIAAIATMSSSSEEPAAPARSAAPTPTPAPAPTVDATAVAASPDAAPAPAIVVDVTVPASAIVRVDGTAADARRVELPVTGHAYTVEVTAQGYVSRTLTVSDATDSTEIALQRKRAHKPKRRPKARTKRTKRTKPPPPLTP